jgi:Amt family ammonium transporter
MWNDYFNKVLFVAPLLGASMAFASEDAAPKIDSGDTAWVLMSAALVLLMTPGLAFFYGGMVRAKNVLSTLFQNFAALAVVGVIWGVVGYSLAFSPTNGGFIGGFDWLMLKGVGQTANADYAATIPHLAFMLFQGMFAVITPALITGAIAERMNFKSWIAIMATWSLLVYAPVAHWVWAVGGWLRSMGGLDFAGGLVVHITAGFSALAAAVILRKRVDFGKTEYRPYDASYVMLGTALLWFGWFGFNAGSALSANGLAAHAFATTFFGAASASVGWVLLDVLFKRKPSAVSGCIGAVVGLVAITPAAGFVPVWSSFVIGALAGATSNLTALFVRERLKLDDSLDVFACHGVGGLFGALMVGVFADKSVNSAGGDGLLLGDSKIFMANLLGSGAVIVYSIVCTIVIVKVVSMFAPLLVSADDEHHGLDKTQHGESINTAVHELSTLKSNGKKAA